MTEAISEAGADNSADSTEAETLPEELIIEDRESSPEDAEPFLVRTAAFLADERTSTFLLPETVASLVSRQKIQSAIVDLSTEAGVAIARQLAESGVAYSVFDTVALKDVPGSPRDTVWLLLARSQGTVPFNPEDIAGIDANIVLMPASPDDTGPYVDVSHGTIANTVIEQLQQAKLNCLMVLPPESGLRRQEDGSYVRLTLKLAE